MQMSNAGKLLSGKTAIITGSGRNIGKAIALLFAENGANVVINGSRNEEAVASVVQEVEELGGQAMAIIADVSNPVDVRIMVDKAMQKFLSVDIAVSNVSIRPRQALLDISIDDWDKVIRTNLSSAFYLAKATVPSMISRDWGRLIHISGHDGFQGASNRAHNVACKAGIHGLTKALAHELGQHHITVNSVSPGVMDTGYRRPEDYPDFEERTQNLKKSLPLRRIGDPEDIAEACLYLASDAAKYVTGQVIHVNGGSYMQ